MWLILSNAVLAFVSAAIGASFLSRLPAPFSGLSVTLIAMSYAIATDRPLTAAVWAAVGGFTLDLFGLHGFGAETAGAWAAYLVLRLLFLRVLTNRSMAAAFLLTAAGAFAWFGMLVSIDGVRALFGGEPLMLSPERALFLTPVLSAIANGAVVAVMVSAESAIRRRVARLFLPVSYARR